MKTYSEHQFFARWSVFAFLLILRVNQGFCTDLQQADIFTGKWSAKVNSNSIDLEFRANGNTFKTAHTFNLRELAGLTFNKKFDVTLIRDAGQINLQGELNNNTGAGTFTFKTAKAYKDSLANLIITGLRDPQDYFQVFLANVPARYILFLNQNGYNGKYNILKLASLGIDENYITQWIDYGFKKISPIILEDLKTRNITIAFADSIKQLGYPTIDADIITTLQYNKVTAIYARQIIDALKVLHLSDQVSLRELVAYRKENVTPNYILQIQATSFQVLHYETIEHLKKTGLTAAFIQAFDAAGMKNLSESEISSYNNAKITPEFIAGFKAMNYSDAEIKTFIPLKPKGITPEFISSFAAVGFKNVPAKTIPNIASSKFSPDDVAEYKAAGYIPLDLYTGDIERYEKKPDMGSDSISLGRLVNYKTRQVTPQYIKQLKDIGYHNIPSYSLINLRGYGITADTIKSYYAVGLRNIPFEDLHYFKGLSADYVKSLQDAGYKNNSVKDYWKIHSEGIRAEYIMHFRKLGFDDIPVADLITAVKSEVTPELVAEMQKKGYQSKDLTKYIKLRWGDMTPWSQEKLAPIKH